MTVRIEINADNGTEAARELKMLADGLAVMGLAQQVLKRHPQDDNPAPVGKTASEAVADASAKSDEKTDEPVKEADTKDAKPAKKTRKSTKKKDEKADIEPATDDKKDTDTSDEAKAAETAEENANPYQLFDDDGKEEELFDTPEQFKTALKSLMTDAPDDMTLVAVAKTNETTMQRLQAEDVDFSDIIDLYKTRRGEFAKAAADASQAEAEGKAEATAKEEAKPEPEKKSEPADDGAWPSLDDVKDAIKGLSAAKGVKTCLATMQEFKATKASEVKTEDRAKFIKAAAEAAK